MYHEPHTSHASHRIAVVPCGVHMSGGCDCNSGGGPPPALLNTPKRKTSLSFASGPTGPTGSSRSSAAFATTNVPAPVVGGGPGGMLTRRHSSRSTPQLNTMACPISPVLVALARDEEPSQFSQKKESQKELIDACTEKGGKTDGSLELLLFRHPRKVLVQLQFSQSALLALVVVMFAVLALLK